MDPLITDSADLPKLRVLVAIASFGKKNLRFLKKILDVYRGMPFEVELVVHSDSPKDLGSDVKVIVGLPTKNPWSLPFAHKSLFAANVENFDLFIYSEDDMEVTADNVCAFIDASSHLAADEIAGYLRYEIGPMGRRSLPEVHGGFHWKPETVRQRGPYIVAEFSNEHAAFYILTKAQLRQALDTNGFLCGPREDRYGMPETAATDPYTVCGFRKVICISAIDSFLIHHLPNKYVDKFGLGFTSIEEQIHTLIKINNGDHPAITLCEIESKLKLRKWSKGFYELPSEELLNSIPSHTESILSIGCGAGATELILINRGAKVTALPLDSVIGAEAAKLGINVIYKPINEGVRNLEPQKFGCIVITNLLHLLPQPEVLIKQLATLLEPEGRLVFSGPNFQSAKILAKRALGRDDYWKLKNYAQSRVHANGIKTIKNNLKKAGLEVIERRWIKHNSSNETSRLPGFLARFSAQEWLIVARR